MVLIFNLAPLITPRRRGRRPFSSRAAVTGPDNIPHIPNFYHGLGMAPLTSPTFAIDSIGLSRIRDYRLQTVKRDGKGKVPDAAWGPRRSPRGIPKSPTVVLEVAVSETDKKLQSDIRFWLNDGNARSCLTARVTRNTPEIRLERWELNYGNARSCLTARVIRDTPEIRLLERWELKNDRPHRAETTWITKKKRQSGYSR